ncbi:MULTISPECIES: DUF4129 domain-containing protein [unclassified Nocardioides]|uniref:DUF4129 domain-containing protein n=1 Tax=unclassified Nocardioides TaxID=2615069 RepID=UPI0000571D2B|nr:MULTISPECIES: DUF4129 domain-containing protein [unclassified Nocardioides]ABL80990.1 hypothetical protein Noca_1476 [Nocardioides sp. JS614]
MTARQASTLAVASVVATALLVVVLGAWAASIGPSGVLRGEGPSPAGTPTVTESTSASAGPAAVDTTSAESRGTPPWVRAFALLVDLAVVVGLVLLAARYAVLPAVRSVRRRRRARLRRTTESLDFPVLEPPAAVAQEILADAASQRRLLAEGGSPRNAVVECWHRFETQAAAAGLARGAWETSSEYTMRVLDLVDAHQPAVTRLGELYREARFSEHPLTEAHRQEALAALDDIHRTIGRSFGVHA